MCVQLPQRPEEGVRTPGVTGSWVNQCHRGWQQNSYPLQNQPVLLTVKPSF